ncbi:MAG TPA: TraM recognition domain-containing protein [Oligoflexia bacterium]|nr:TraM recognition domain-containing protein [Oligoflexia bacterium]HMP48332.1 TraM recognition domain-containing protein [Oligoflexia bacterium]
MARDYIIDNFRLNLETRRHNIGVLVTAYLIGVTLFTLSSFSSRISPFGFAVIAGIFPFIGITVLSFLNLHHRWLEKERMAESARRGGKPVLGMPPQRRAFDIALKEMREKGKPMIDRYLVGFEIESGEPIWVTDDELCSHAAVFAKTGVGKTLWLEGLMFQQMNRGRASGLTFIDAKRDPGTLADIIMMALITGRIEDVIVVDPFDPVCAYNFVFTTQRADVKARKVLRCGLPPTSDQSTTKHYDRLAADAVYRVVRAMESLGLAWSVRDIAVALSAFNYAYPRMRDLLNEQGSKQAMIELGHLASSYRNPKGQLDSQRLTDNLRGIASELHSIANSDAGEMFCVPRADLSLTDAILRGKIIYYMLPRLEEAESAARMVKVFREDLEVSIGEITSSRTHHLEDPHLVVIDEGASTFGPTWANLFELARKGRFALLFGAQSVGGLMDQSMGLSEQFYERVIANVNLKVIMRIGDNKTAEDMCEWIGKINTTKKTLATGMSSSLSARELTKHIELNRRSADGFRDGVTFAEDETDLVSAEELKHEMSAEKGLAWFDKGDGRLRKGRSIWFDADLPATWEGREYLTRYESVEADEIGLAEWVDEHILSVERSQIRRGGNDEDHDNGYSGKGDSRSHAPSGGSSSSGVGTDSPSESHSGASDEGGGFRLNLLKGFRGSGGGRARITTVTAPSPVTIPAQADTPAERYPEIKAQESAIEKESIKEHNSMPHNLKASHNDSVSLKNASVVDTKSVEVAESEGLKGRDVNQKKSGSGLRFDSDRGRRQTQVLRVEKPNAPKVNVNEKFSTGSSEVRKKKGDGATQGSKRTERK